MNDEEEVRLKGNNSGYDRQNSVVSGNSKKGGEELLESLKQMDETGPHFYQSEIKRFETSNNLNARPADQGGSKSPELETGIQATPSSTMPLIRQQSAQNRKKRYFNTLGQSGQVDKASLLIKKRKLCRLFTLIGIYTIMIGVASFLFYFGAKKETRIVQFDNKDITLSLMNCRLFIEPCDSCKETGFSLDYRSSINKIFSKVIHTQTIMFQETGSKVEYSVNHFDDIKGCNLRMWVPKSLTLRSFNIDCPENCVVIQKSSEFQTKNLTIKGGSVSVNMAKTTVGNLKVNITTGYFQVNHILFLNDATYTRTVLLGMGDIILHTTSSVKANFTSAVENYCFSAYSSSLVTAVTKTAISSPLISYVTQAHLTKDRFSYQWQGAYNLCSSAGCSGSIPTMTLCNFDGNIYLNVMETIPSIVSATASIVKGSKYGTMVGLSEDAKEDILKFQDMTSQTSLPNLILRMPLSKS